MSSESFKSTIEDCSLVEAGLKGGEFTWEKSKGTPNWVRERLDRAFATNSWWHIFPLCSLTIFHATISDHDPIKLELFNVAVFKKQFRFNFENTWLKELKFHMEVSNYWKDLPKIHLLPKLILVSSFMAKWGRQFFHKFREKVKNKKALIDALVKREDKEGIKMYVIEKEMLHELLTHEESYWRQRAKTFWLEDGDTNSRFFHATASFRKKIESYFSFKN
ncbi:uncharacterized protein LOC141691411 [Apium graveolens]|uniref:uncharacterized protein LOC141691411 n=1 Tax=Apium graveolens TaxID=4045 RepID=UPI003D79504B